MTQQAGGELFDKIPGSRKKIIFRELAFDKEKLSIKELDGENIYHATINECVKDELLICRMAEDVSKLTGSIGVVVNFKFKSEIYFFQTVLNIEKGWVLLSIKNDLYQVQRRDNARIVLPKEYPAEFVISELRNIGYSKTTKIKDISAGGLKLEIKDLDIPIKSGDILKGSLKLGIRRPIDLEGEVRYLKPSSDNDPQSTHVGIMFLNLNSNVETRLLNLVLDIQREIYLKFSK